MRALVITGAGRAFCAGQDLKEHLTLVAAGDPRVATTVREFYNPLVLAITGMAKPVIAAVNGAAAGAGAALALRATCGSRRGRRRSRWRSRRRAVADTGASFILPRLIGRAGRPG